MLRSALSREPCSRKRVVKRSSTFTGGVHNTARGRTARAAIAGGTSGSPGARGFSTAASFVTPAMTVVQITDLHLFSDPRASLPELPDRPTLASLAGVLNHIERNVPHLDALVISGDIAATRDDEGAYGNLRQQLAKRGGLLSRTVRTAAIPSQPPQLDFQGGRQIACRCST